MTSNPVDGTNDQSPLSLPEGGNVSGPKFEFAWQDLHESAQYLSDEAWSQAQIPAILDLIPENLVVSQQLQQILSWSLKHFEDRRTDVQPAEQEQNDAGELSPIAQGKLPSRANTVRAPPSTGHYEITRTLSLSRARSQKALPLITRLKQLRQDVANKMASGGPSSSSSGVTDPQSQKGEPAVEPVEPNGECISCFDEHPKRDLIHLTCSHDYCKVCLREVVLTAVKNESAFPPKCCLSEIPLKTVLICLEKKERDEYREKSAEYAIPAGHRWYCPEPKCSKWIRPERLHRNRRDHQTCPHCKASICSTCRSLAHDNQQDCPQDFGLESTLEVAESEGWRRCYSCRTMVELTTGCRHITCRCGAEFCYVCNARWRTCNCTEADKERRIRELRAQREQRTQIEEDEARRREEEDEMARMEAEEMAEAIRQVEELERQEAIRTVEEERRRQLEEELILAQLEETRLIEEIARREEEEEAERHFREILITSLKEECQAMMKTLMQIINHQHAALMSTHTTREQNSIQERKFREAQRASQTDTMLVWLQENVNRRKDCLNGKQQSEWEALLLQAQNEEDDMFMQMHMYLRDKPNREQREKRMRDTFQEKQRLQTDKLQQRHDDERKKLETGISYEFEGLQKAVSVQLEPLVKEHEIRLQTLGHQIGCDRKWFQLVCTRRINMLNVHKRMVLQQLEAEEEPTGLTEDEARSISPILPALDNREAGPSTAVPMSVRVEGLPPLQEETFDLYSGSTDERPLISAPPESNNLGRSDTVIRSIPGAFPTYPTASSSVSTALSTQSAISPPLPPTSTYSFENHSQSSIMDRPRPPTRKPFSDQSPPTQSSIPPPPPPITTIPSTSSLSTISTTNTNTSTSTLSAGTTPTSSHASKHSSTSTSTSFSTSDADTLDTISSNILTKNGSITEQPGKKKGLGAVFRGFGKKKEISEEEIRRRMSTRGVVGDGWGV